MDADDAEHPRRGRVSRTELHTRLEVGGGIELVATPARRLQAAEQTGHLQVVHRLGRQHPELFGFSCPLSYDRGQGRGAPFELGGIDPGKAAARARAHCCRLQSSARLSGGPCSESSTRKPPGIVW